MVSIEQASGGYIITWAMKDNQTAKIILSEEDYTIENSNQIFVSGSKIIHQIKIFDCSGDSITENYEQATAIFNFSK